METTYIISKIEALQNDGISKSRPGYAADDRKPTVTTTAVIGEGLLGLRWRARAPSFWQLYSASLSDLSYFMHLDGSFSSSPPP